MVIFGVGIGAAALVVSVIDGVLLRPLPYPEPERLTLVRTDLPIPGRSLPASSGPELLDLRESTPSFESLGGLWYRPGALTDDAAAPEDIDMVFVTAGLMETLGVAPRLGRIPHPDEDVDRETRVIVLSEQLWSRRYGADPDLLDRQIEFDGVPHTVIGIMPAEVRLHLPPEAGVPRHVDAWVPFGGRYDEYARGWRVFTVLGRLRSESSIEASRVELAALAERLRETHGDTYAASGLVLRPEPLSLDFVAHVRPMLLILLGAVGLVLAIVCANVASLYLSRISETDRELAVRTALGASRGQLLRQLVAESAVVVVAGAALGVLAARQGLRVLPAWMPAAVPRLESLTLDIRVLAIMAGVAAVCSILFGCLPLMQRRAPGRLIREGTRSTGGAARVRRGLVVAEIALCLSLVVGVGLLLRSFTELTRIDPGFDTDGVATVKLSLVDSNYPYREPARIADFYRRLIQGLEAAPGVEAVGATTTLPLDGAVDLAPYAIETRDGESEWGSRSADLRTVTAGWLEAMGARRVAGRTIQWRDDVEAPMVAVIDTTLAAAAWGSEPAVGQRIKVEVFLDGVRAQAWAEVIGVVDHLYQTPGRRGPEQIFVAHSQAPMRTMAVALRTDRGVADMLDTVAATAHSIDADQPVQRAIRLSEYFDDAVAPVRVALLLLSAFAVVAVGLAVVGVYGVIAFGVARRKREIGIQMAVGATPATVVRGVLAEGTMMVLAGILVGTLGALGLTGFLGNLLIGVGTRDPLTFAVGALILGAVAVCASWLPARSAARLDPTVALRNE